MIRRALPLLLAPLLACSPGPVDWEDSVRVLGDLNVQRGLARDERGRVRTEVVPELLPPPAPGHCRAVMGSWRDRGPAYAAWWSLRPDQSANLMFASTTDGRTWTAPVLIDSADAGRTGCDRPPPAISADGDNVHIVYAMRAREGPGFFLSHSMDGGALFHSPVAVVYGEKPGLASVSARGNFVIVAYEDPNTNPQRISVAISSTMAHLFQYRHIVSPPGEAVAAPMAFTDGSVAIISWLRATERTTRLSRWGTVR